MAIITRVGGWVVIAVGALLAVWAVVLVIGFLMQNIWGSVGGWLPKLPTNISMPWKSSSVDALDAADEAKRQKEAAAKAEADRMAEAAAKRLEEEKKWQLRTGKGSEVDILQVYTYDTTGPAGLSNTVAAGVYVFPHGFSTIKESIATGKTLRLKHATPGLTYRIVVQYAGQQKELTITQPQGYKRVEFRFP